MANKIKTHQRENLAQETGKKKGSRLMKEKWQLFSSVVMLVFTGVIASSTLLYWRETTKLWETTRNTAVANLASQQIVLTRDWYLRYVEVECSYWDTIIQFRQSVVDDCLAQLSQKKANGQVSKELAEELRIQLLDARLALVNVSRTVEHSAVKPVFSFTVVVDEIANFLPSADREMLRRIVVQTVDKLTEDIKRLDEQTGSEVRDEMTRLKENIDKILQRIEMEEQ